MNTFSLKRRQCKQCVTFKELLRLLEDTTCHLVQQIVLVWVQGYLCSQTMKDKVRWEDLETKTGNYTVIKVKTGLEINFLLGSTGVRSTS